MADTNPAREAADAITILVTEIIESERSHSDVPIDDMLEIRDDVRELGRDLNENIDHKFSVGDYVIDGSEPTPSPEANIVEVVELIDQRADEFVIEDTGTTVAEENEWYPEDDPVVAGSYPNMGNPEKVWHFPESRLRRL
jgi:hypothetical protein